MTTGAVYTHLPERASVSVHGEDSERFLQGLITQDISLLSIQPLIYACLLTPQGKFLYDFFIRKDNDAFILDCEGGERGVSLLKRLSMYRLRSKVTLELTEISDVWQVWGGEYNGLLPDPRLPALGYRTYTPPKGLKEATFDQWDEYRIRHEIPDGSRDLIPEKSFLHEGRLDDLHAVSYTKGCYVGQELVSRMHHRGLTKKILKCVALADLPEDAELRSSCNGIGLALVRL